MPASFGHTNQGINLTVSRARTPALPHVALRLQLSLILPKIQVVCWSASGQRE